MIPRTVYESDKDRYESNIIFQMASFPDLQFLLRFWLKLFATFIEAVLFEAVVQLIIPL